MAPTGEVLADTGYMPLDVAYPKFFPQFPVRDLGLVAHPWSADVAEIHGPTLFLSVPERFHIGHWMVDFLPRLRALAHLPSDTKVALPHEAPKKLFEMLALFGLGEDRLVTCHLGQRYRAQILVVTKPGNHFRPDPQTVSFLRGALGPKTVPPSKPSRRIFLERNVPSRQIVNRAEVDAILSEFGFAQVNLARMSIAEQRALLADTEVAVGAFGTDLLCAYFLPEKSSVLELIWDIKENPVVRATCQIIGVRHEFLVCKATEHAGFRSYRKDRDFTVDCSALRSALESLT